MNSSWNEFSTLRLSHRESVRVSTPPSPEGEARDKRRSAAPHSEGRRRKNEQRLWIIQRPSNLGRGLRADSAWPRGGGIARRRRGRTDQAGYARAARNLTAPSPPGDGRPLAPNSKRRS